MLFFDFFQRKTSRKFGVSNKNNYLCSRKSSGFSAVGSAHVWGARGRWFESSNPDSSKAKILYFSVLAFVAINILGENSASYFVQMFNMPFLIKI